MRSFLRAYGARDYAGVCAGLASLNREQLAQFTKSKSGSPHSCPALLAKLLSPTAAPEAKRAAAGAISGVRIGKGTAFVLFRPAGGKPSYFVLKEEDGAWKAIGLAPGTPLHP
jgi:hypothetical protein